LQCSLLTSPAAEERAVSVTPSKEQRARSHRATLFEDVHTDEAHVECRLGLTFEVMEWNVMRIHPANIDQDIVGFRDF
jgi:hypothetical protein